MLLIIIGYGVLIGVAFTLLFALYQFHQNEKEKKQNSEYCNKCEKAYSTCSICGCQYSNAHDAHLCEEWDKILHKKHEHTYLHNHEKKENQ